MAGADRRRARADGRVIGSPQGFGKLKRKRDEYPARLKTGQRAKHDRAEQIGARKQDRAPPGGETRAPVGDNLPFALLETEIGVGD